jgi:hypothetical protein
MGVGWYGAKGIVRVPRNQVYVVMIDDDIWIAIDFVLSSSFIYYKRTHGNWWKPDQNGHHIGQNYYRSDTLICHFNLARLYVYVYAQALLQLMM